MSDEQEAAFHTKRQNIIPDWIKQVWKIGATLFMLCGTLKFIYENANFTAFTATLKTYIRPIQWLAGGLIYGIGHAADAFDNISQWLTGWMPIALSQEKRETLLFAIAVIVVLSSFTGTIKRDAKTAHATPTKAFIHHIQVLVLVLTYVVLTIAMFQSSQLERGALFAFSLPSFWGVKMGIDYIRSNDYKTQTLVQKFYPWVFVMTYVVMLIWIAYEFFDFIFGPLQWETLL